MKTVNHRGTVTRLKQSDSEQCPRAPVVSSSPATPDCKPSLQGEVRRAPRPGRSRPPTALDVQLRQRAGEGGVDGGDLLVGDLLAESGRGSLPRLFGFGLVDALGG